MPKVRRSRKPPPEGWELIEPTIEELDAKMREHETEPHEGKRKVRVFRFTGSEVHAQKVYGELFSVVGTMNSVE